MPSCATCFWGCSISCSHGWGCCFSVSRCSSPFSAAAKPTATATAGSGTILYFYDRKVVESLQKQYPLYADNFPVWASQSSAMLQLAVWSGLRELNIGASLQHYNPVIDNAVKELLHLSGDYVLVAEMPFGGIVEEPAPKDKEEIEKRVFSAC